MNFAVVDFYRVTTRAPFIPGGVALPDSLGAWHARYDPAEVASEATVRFRTAVRHLQDATDGGMDYREAITRLGRSGFSGYLSWQVGIRIPDDATLGALFKHYVTNSSVQPFPGSEPMDLSDLVFG